MTNSENSGIMKRLKPLKDSLDKDRRFDHLTENQKWGAAKILFDKRVREDLARDQAPVMRAIKAVNQKPYQ